MSNRTTHRPAGARPRRLEIEAKFAIPDERTFERLHHLDRIGDYVLTAGGEQEVTDVYLDTSERHLLHAGWGCRIRDGVRPGRTLVTLKSLGRARGAVHRRQEHEIEIAPGLAPGSWPPGPVRDTVSELSRGRALAPLLTLRQHRILHAVRRAERTVAVRFLDRVEVQSGDRRHTSLELELELAAEGTLADLQDLEQALRRFRLQPHAESKLERALAWIESGKKPAPGDGAAAAASDGRPRARQKGAAARRAAAVPTAAAAPAPGPVHKPAKRKRKGPDIRADEPFAEAGRKILAFHCERMLQHEDGTRAGSDPEELHDMRVATRRQRAALRIVQPHFRRKAVRPVRDGLRAAAGVLGAVRDLDVLLEAARGYQKTLEADESAALQPLLESWAARRDAAREAMLAHLDSREWSAFKQEYGVFLATPGAGARSVVNGELPRAQLVAHVVPAEVWQHYGAIRAYESVLPWAAVETLHALRIECKRLRYVLEFFQETLDPEVEEPIGALVALQDHLGLLNDSHVTIGLVREFLAGAHAAANGAVGVAAGRYLEFHQERVQALRRGVDAPWRRVAGAGFRQVLARAVAVL
jgi:CHAD domain-containing protein